MSDNRWISFPRPNPEAVLRLFCFPFAGAGGSIFYSWKELLDPGIELCCLQYPGREKRRDEESYRDLPALVEATARAVGKEAEKPFVFFGHSMGALMAFETARHLRREHQASPLLLFLSGMMAPHLVENSEERIMFQTTDDLSDEAFIAMMRQSRGFEQGMLDHEEMLESMLAVLRTDYHMLSCYAYREEAPLECDIYAFGGVDDHISGDAIRSWEQYTGNRFYEKMFPGDHFFVRSSREAVIEEINRELQFLMVRHSLKGGAAGGIHWA